MFHREAANLPEVVSKHVAIMVGTTNKGWTIANDVVLFEGRVFMPSSSCHWAQVLEKAHGIRQEGVQKMLQRLRASFYTSHDNRLVH
jgi:hypothetical protein